MTTVSDILKELNLENGSIHKLAVMKKYKDHELLQRVLQMTYDNVVFTYGISMKNTAFDPDITGNRLSLEAALDRLEQLSNRELTGNAAREMLERTFNELSPEDADVVKKIVNRDLRINAGRSIIKKVWKDLILKPAYMRCGTYNKKSAKDISFPAIVQLKADGTYREFSVEDNKVSAKSRSGESYEYPVLFDAMLSMPQGRYFGELVVIKDGKILDRQTGNGLINSDEPPHEDIYFQTWDYVTHEEYALAMNKGKPKTPYHERLDHLSDIIDNQDCPNVELIETHEVSNLREALELTSGWMSSGLEGSILKDKKGTFKDGTSKHQLKLKLEITVDVRITGFKEGREGTVREKTFGAIEFATDDGMITGKTSGFTNAQLEDFNSRREEMIGTVMAVTCNDLIKGRDSEIWSLSHPRFDEIRTDKTETDDLQRVLDLREMAMELGGE